MDGHAGQEGFDSRSNGPPRGGGTGTLVHVIPHRYGSMTAQADGYLYTDLGLLFRGFYARNGSRRGPWHGMADEADDGMLIVGDDLRGQKVLIETFQNYVEIGRLGGFRILHQGLSLLLVTLCTIRAPMSFHVIRRHDWSA